MKHTSLYRTLGHPSAEYSVRNKVYTGAYSYRILHYQSTYSTRLESKQQQPGSERSALRKVFASTLCRPSRTTRLNQCSPLAGLEHCISSQCHESTTYPAAMAEVSGWSVGTDSTVHSTVVACSKPSDRNLGNSSFDLSAFQPPDHERE
jgi:hypothetical protein